MQIKYLVCAQKKMKMNIDLSLFLDTRRAKRDNSYPVKLRVYSPEIQKAKLYSTQYSLTEKEFKASWLSQKPRKENKDLKISLEAIITKAREASEEMKKFEFEVFEKKAFRKRGEGQNVFYHYQEKIEELERFDRISTKSNYELSMKSIEGFMKHRSKSGRASSKLYFDKINKKWLLDYQNYMIKTKKYSKTTVGIYLRPLRAMFNKALNEREIDRSIYPFTKTRYTIPEPRKVKKALNSEELQLLFHAPELTPAQIKARDFWFFSFGCMGMNMKDIALLKHSDLQKESFSYYRAKTENTRKSPEPIVVHFNDFTKKIIELYQTFDNGPYVFSIIDHFDGPEDNHKQIQNFTRFVNQHIKKIAKKIGINPKLSTYWARHSFATSSIRKGQSMEFVSEALNHQDMKTTKRYFKGFDDNVKKEFAQSIMEF